MVPQPKRKLSKGRRDRRRAHDALTPMTGAMCPLWRDDRRHTVCPLCGYYQGREVLHIEKEDKKK